MTDQPPMSLDYHDSNVSLDIPALLSRGRRARRRRTLLMSAVAATTVLALVGAGAGVAEVRGASHTRTSITGTSTDSPWSQTQGNAAASRANLSETTLTPSTVTKIRLLRTYTPQGPSTCSASVGSVLSGGDVITLVNGHLVRYVASTGHVTWSASFDDGDAVAMDITGGEVIVGYHECGSASDPEGWVAGYSLATGKQVWRSYSVPTCSNGMCDDHAGMAGMVVADGDIVTGGNALASGYSVAVLNASNGVPVWEDTTSTCPVSAPVVINQQVIFTKCSSTGQPRMVADALTTGIRTWQDTGTWTVQRGDFSKNRGHNLLATSPTGTVTDISPANGHVLRTLSGARTVLADDGIRAYATCGPTPASGGLSSVCAYALSSGNRIWKSDGHPSTTIASEGGGVLYLDSGAMLNATSGASLGTVFRSAPGTVDGISVGEGRLNIITPTTSRLYGLDGG